MFSNPFSQRLLAVLLSFSLLFGGCASRPKADRVIPFTGDHLAYHQDNIAAASARNKVLWQYRAAATALRRDKRDIAKTHLDNALASIAANYGSPSKDAAKARGMFKRESDKPFIGEPYERVMACFYRALLYWADGEPDNARALLRTAALIDTDVTDRTFAADYILLDYLEGFLSAKLAGNNPAAGADALTRARASAAAQQRPAPPGYDLDSNVHIFVEYGRAPYKFAGGKHGEQLQFSVRDTTIRHVELRVGAHTIALPAYDDLAYQAVTRGDRLMDYILGNKAAFKENTGAVADAAFAAPAWLARGMFESLLESELRSPPDRVAYAQPSRAPSKDKNAHAPDSKNDDGDSGKKVIAVIAIAIAALIAIGITAASLSKSAKPEADTRAWDNLPRHLCYVSLKLPPGEHVATLDFLDENRAPVYLQKQTFTIVVPARAPAAPGATKTPAATFTAAPADIIVFRSQLHD